MPRPVCLFHFLVLSSTTVSDAKNGDLCAPKDYRNFATCNSLRRYARKILLADPFCLPAHDSGVRRCTVHAILYKTVFLARCVPFRKRVSHSRSLISILSTLQKHFMLRQRGPGVIRVMIPLCASYDQFVLRMMPNASQRVNVRRQSTPQGQSFVGLRYATIFSRRLRSPGKRMQCGNLGMRCGIVTRMTWNLMQQHKGQQSNDDIVNIAKGQCSGKILNAEPVRLEHLPRGAA